MKVFLVFVVLGGCVVLAASRCSVEFGTFGSGTNGPMSPAMNDVLAIRAAAVGEGDQPVLDLLKRASNMNRGAGAALIEQEISARTETAITSLDLGRQRISAVALETSAGSYCRAALIRFASQEQWLMRRVASDVAQKRSTWKAVNRFVYRITAVARAYTADLNPCITAAPREDRNAIQQAMLS